MDITKKTLISFDNISSNISCQAWHPHRPIINIGIKNKIYVCNAISGAVESKITLEKGQIITHLVQLSQHNFLVAATNKGNIYAWECDTYTLYMERQEDKEIAFLVASCVHPYIFFTKGSKNIYQLDITNEAPLVRLDAKKKVSSLITHPTKPLMASGNTDGQVRVWDYQINTSKSSDDMGVNKHKLAESPNGVTCLSFHTTLDYIFAASDNGNFAAFKIEGQQLSLAIAKPLIQKSTEIVEDKLVSIDFHPLYFFIMSTYESGKILFWEFQTKGKKQNLITSAQVKPGSIIALDKNMSQDFLPEYSREEYIPAYVLSHFLHPKENLFTFLFKKSSEEKTIRLIIYNFIENLSPLDDMPVCTKCTLPVNFFSEDKTVFTYPSDVNFYYIKKNQLIQLSLVFGENVIIKRLGIQDKKNNSQPIRIVRGPQHSLVIIFQHKSFTNANRVRTITSNYNYLYLGNVHSDSQQDLANLPEGKDAVFIGKTDQYIILSNDGKSISHYSAGKLLTTDEPWERPMHRIFATPLVKGKGILYYDLQNNCLLWSRNVGSSAAVRGLSPDFMNISSKLQLMKNELLIDMQWQTLDGNFFVASIITDKRLFLVNKDFKIFASVSAPNPTTRPHFNSCLWVGASLLFTTNSPPQVSYLTLNGTVSPLSLLKHHSTILAAVLNDRIFYLQPSINHTEVYSHAVGLLEPLILGYLLLPHRKDNNSLREKFTRLLQRFDCSRISEKLIFHLDRNGYADYAYSLISSTKGHKYLELPISENSLRFEVSFNILFEEYKKTFKLKVEENDEIEKVIPNSHPLSLKFANLAGNCVEFGQFSIAKRCYEITGDYLSLLYLLIVNKNRKGIEWLLEKTQKDNSLKEITFACQKQLEMDHNNQFNNDPKLRDWKFNSLYNKGLFTTTNTVNETMKCPTTTGELESIPLLDELDNLQKWLPIRIEYYSERSLGGTSNVGTDSAVKGGDKNNVDNGGAEGDDNSEETESEGEEEYLESPIELLKIPSRPVTTKTSASTLCSTSNFKKRVFSQLEEAESEDSDHSQNSSSQLSETPKNIRLPIKLNYQTNYSSPRVSSGGLTPPTLKDSPNPPKKENPTTQKDDEKEEISVKEVGQQIEENRFAPNSFDDPSLQRFASEFLISALKKLEANKFMPALEDVNKSIKCLLSTSDPFSKKKEIGICVNYKLALKLLILIGNLKKDRNSNISKLGLFTVMLCTIPMQKKHRSVCYKNAITENMNGKNYGIVAKLIKQITSKDPTLVDTYQNYLDICNENKLENQHSWANQIDVVSLHFCYKKLEIISEKDEFLSCELCNAVFSKDSNENPCSYCGHLSNK